MYIIKTHFSENGRKINASFRCTAPVPGLVTKSHTEVSLKSLSFPQIFNFKQFDKSKFDLSKDLREILFMIPASGIIPDYPIP